MISDPGELQVAGRERMKRWVRIHVLRRQNYDLFYPINVESDNPACTAHLLLDRPHKLPNCLHVNGERTCVKTAELDGRIVQATLERPELVLPGENVVALPVSCDPRSVQLVTERHGSQGAQKIGWGSISCPRPATGDRHIDAAATFLVNSLSSDIFGNGLISLTVWDPCSRCARLWSWYWTTGIVYEALCKLVDRGAIELDLAPLEQGLLDRQLIVGSDDVRGSFMVRWDPDRSIERGVIPWHAPNDAAHLGLHGLLVAHRRCGDALWLQRAQLLADWIVANGITNGRLRVGWDAARHRWDDSWHYIDAAWTPAFFIAMYEHTHRRKWLQIAEDLARDTIERFAAGGAFYIKIWRSNGRHTKSIFSRGMAWVLEGWLPLLAHGCEWLRPRISRLVDALIVQQTGDGAWPYLLDRPELGPCNKGTPALAYQLNRARALLPELASRLEESVQRALFWCEQSMIMEEDSPGRGGIVAHNAEGAIATVRRIPTAINYGSAYYILAREERR